MASVWERPQGALGETRFFLVMALLMSATIVAGFSLNLAMERSSFAVPVIYHIHAVVFFGWVVLYLAQNSLISAGNITMHRRLGKLALVWVPLMIALGFAIMITSIRRTGGPFFFDQNEFLISNSLSLACFGGLVFAGLFRRRYTGWHRRLMFCSMAILTGPGLGRLLPGPLMIPHAWKIIIATTLIFPVIGMIADWRRNGRIHPAWFWGVGAIVGAQVLGDIIAYSPFGISLTEMVLAGSPGAERPMAAFLPPGFGG